MHLIAAVAVSWLFAYHAGKFSSHHTNRMFTNVVIGTVALAGSVLGLVLGMGIQLCFTQ